MALAAGDEREGDGDLHHAVDHDPAQAPPYRAQQAAAPRDRAQHDGGQHHARPGQEARRQPVVHRDLDEQVGDAPEHGDGAEAHPCTRAHLERLNTRPTRGRSKGRGRGYVRPMDEEDEARPVVGNWFAGTAIALALGLILVLVLLVTGALFDSLDDLVTVALAGVAVAAVAGWYQDKLARAEADQVEAARQRQAGARDRGARPRAARALPARAALPLAARASPQAPSASGRASCASRSRACTAAGPAGPRRRPARDGAADAPCSSPRPRRGCCSRARTATATATSTWSATWASSTTPPTAPWPRTSRGGCCATTRRCARTTPPSCAARAATPPTTRSTRCWPSPSTSSDDFSGVVVCANRAERVRGPGRRGAAGAGRPRRRGAGERPPARRAALLLRGHGADAGRGDRGEGPLHPPALRGGGRVRGLGGREPGDPAQPARGAADRVAAARRGQDRHLRAHPAQARPADPGGARGDRATPADRLPAGAPGAGAAGGRARGPAPPRALGRQRLPRRSGRRRDPAGGTRDLRGRLLLRDDRRPALPRAPPRGGGVRRAGALRGHASSTPGWWPCSWRRSAPTRPAHAPRAGARAWTPCSTTPRCRRSRSPTSPWWATGPRGRWTTSPCSTRTATCTSAPPGWPRTPRSPTAPSR